MVQIVSLKQLCVFIFLHGGFFVFIHNFFLVGLVIPSLDIFLSCWTRTLMNQVEELDYIVLQLNYRVIILLYLLLLPIK